MGGMIIFLNICHDDGDEDDVGEKSDPYHPSSGKSKNWQLGGIFSHTHLTELANHHQHEFGNIVW